MAEQLEKHHEFDRHRVNLLSGARGVSRCVKTKPGSLQETQGDSVPSTSFEFKIGDFWRRPEPPGHRFAGISLRPGKFSAGGRALRALTSRSPLYFSAVTAATGVRAVLSSDPDRDAAFDRIVCVTWAYSSRVVRTVSCPRRSLTVLRRRRLPGAGLTRPGRRRAHGVRAVERDEVRR